jgi:sulfur carrier protein
MRAEAANGCILFNPLRLQRRGFFVFGTVKQMALMINGKEEHTASGMSLLGYLESAGFKLDVVVVEYNARIVDRENWAEVTLCDGDCLEIVSFVGGG